MPRAASTLAGSWRKGRWRGMPSPAFYFYRQIMGSHRQTGLVAAASCEDYLHGIIKKHELTRPDKENDRVRHMEALNAQTGPVFLVYPATRQMDELAAAQTAPAPDIDFTAADGVRHTSWTVREAGAVAAIRSAFAAMPLLYIADGHHRSAAAARVYQSRHGAGGSGHFLSVLFPHNQVQIQAYNRVLKDLNGLATPHFSKSSRRYLPSRRAARPSPEPNINWVFIWPDAGARCISGRSGRRGGAGSRAWT